MPPSQHAKRASGTAQGPRWTSHCTPALHVRCLSLLRSLSPILYWAFLKCMTGMRRQTLSAQHSFVPRAQQAEAQYPMTSLTTLELVLGH